MKRLLPIIFGILVIVFGAFVNGMVSNSNKVCTVDAEGTVITYNETVDDEGSHIFYPVVQYNFGGKMYKEQASVGSGNKPYADGDIVLVHINPDNPYQFTIDGSTNIFGIFAWIAIGVGIVIIISGVISILRYGFAGGGGGGGQEMGLIAIIMALVSNAKEKKKEQSSSGDQNQ